MNRKKIGGVLVGLFICALFLIPRLKALSFQTVGYTYDQGRDFLKVAEMILYRNPTFLGPTTGIMGLYHGAWWYYVLTIPFLLFRGLPIGFYYFNLLVQFLSLVLFFIFARKYFGLVVAFIFSTVIALSPYFIFTSVFVGNNIMVLPVLLGFLIVNFIVLEEKKVPQPFLLAFLTGLLLGLVAEFELSFGIFLVPAYFLGLFLFKKFRTFYGRIFHLVLFFFGLFLAFGPRILFELRHQFQQTKILLSFFTKPKLYNPKPYIDILADRLNLFKGYYEGIFPHTIFTVLFSVTLVGMLIYIIRNKATLHRTALLFFVYLLSMLFFMSTLYKDNFWGNYYEGIHYLFISIFAVIFAAKLKIKKMDNYLKVGLLSLLLIFGLWRFTTDIGKLPKKEGLAVQSEVVQYIIAKESNKQNYCVRIYTPPVIPYTYDYLFLYSKLRGMTNTPQKEWTDNHCWFIVEKDDYKERQKVWTDANFPAQFVSRDQKAFPDVDVIRYQLK